MSAAATAGEHALVLDGERLALGDVALKLVRMGLPVHYARGADEALMLVRQEAGRIRVVLVPPEIDRAQAGEVLAAARQRAPEDGVPMVVIGPEPPEASRAALREVGAAWAVWEPFDESDLRFALNGATALPSELAPRREPRGPVSLMGWVVLRGTRSFGVICSLSAKGAFIEMPQPFAIGEEVELEFNLHETSLTTRAKVIYRNPRDQPASPLLPVGAGLLFLELEEPVQERIREFVKARAERFTV